MNKVYILLKGVVLILLTTSLYQCNSHTKDVSSNAPANELIEWKIKPSVTDPSIIQTDVEHLIKFNRATDKNKLLLFLPGTNGVPERGPQNLFNVAVEQGYKVINLSYINQPAVARICKGENLENDIDCTEKFRTQRVFGTQLTTLIPDQIQDAIIPRFMKLLIHLNEIDPKGNWNNFIKGNEPNWALITVAGQSQGGGMAAFIAKKKMVRRIITFSGGWDFQAKKKIAKWYAFPSVTPADRYYGIYHQKEPMAAFLAETYEAMNIPKNHIFALDLEIREGKKAHGEGIRNVVYKKMWMELFD